MDKLKPKAVIFDLGSTLIEYEKVPWSELSIICMKEVSKYLRKQNYTIPDDDEFIRLFEEVKSDYRKLAADKHIEWSIPQASEALLKRLEIEVENGLAEKMFEAYYKPVDKVLEVYDDTAETLANVKAKGYTVGLISNTIFPESAHLKELKRFKLDSYFDFKMFSSTFGVRKPHPDIFYKAANMAGCAPSECVYIGDRYIEDVTGPNGIGMHAILKKLENREYPSDMPETISTINRLSEISEFIDLEENE